MKSIAHILELEPPQTYSNPNLPGKVVEDINNALNMGWKVIVPEDTGELPVIPYIKYDPNTGSAGYMIATQAGGQSGYIEGETELSKFISYELSFWEPKTLLSLDFDVYEPEDGKTVLLGDVFDIYLKMILKWRLGDSEWTEELTEGSLPGVPFKLKIRTGPWVYTSNNQPLPWWWSGHYKITYDKRTIYDFNVWGPVVDIDKSDKYLGIFTENEVDRLDNPMKVRYSIKQYPGMTISAPTMKIYQGESVIRSIPVGIGENLEVNWDGKNSSGQIVAPGDYGVAIEARGTTGGMEKLIESQKHKVTVFKVDFDTNCEILESPYKCVPDSFIALRYRSGDIVRAKAKGITGKLNQSVSWECMGDLYNGIDNGSCNIFPSDIEWFKFIPNPPAAPNGRNRPLAYIVKATLVIDGKSYESKAKIKQDKLDELRQEYEDLPERTSQPRENFDQDPPAYEKLLDRVANDIERNRHDDPDANHNWHILKLHDLNRHATETKSYYNNLNITSGYRCPRGNALVRGENKSNHQYGQAFDFDQTTSQDNYDAFLAARSANAEADTYLTLSNGERYFWRKPPPSPDLLPSGITYTKGHAAWE